MTPEIRRLVDRWREKANSNDCTPILHPHMADDLKLGASIWAVARRECADDLEKLASPARQELHGEPMDKAGYVEQEAAHRHVALSTLAERAKWYREGCEGLEDVAGYYSSGDCARDAASDIETALSEIRVLERVIQLLRERK